MVKYKSLEVVGKDFIDILNKNNSQCSYDDAVTFGGNKIRTIKCTLKNRETLRIEYHKDTGKILEIIKLVPRERMLTEKSEII